MWIIIRHPESNEGPPGSVCSRDFCLPTTFRMMTFFHLLLHSLGWLAGMTSSIWSFLYQTKLWFSCMIDYQYNHFDLWLLTMLWIKNSITIIEPIWGKQFMIGLNNRIHKHEILLRLIPFTADAFVFTYPGYLVVLYVRGIHKRSTYYKEAALYMFFSAMWAASINQVIQFFWDKSRPEEAIANQWQLILSHLPTDPFPSDHAAVSAAIAMSTMLWGMRKKDKVFLRLSIFFWVACGLMSFSRVAVAIHWPTDIIVWIIVWVTFSWFLLKKRIWNWVLRKIIKPLIQFEKWLFEKVFGIIQE